MVNACLLNGTSLLLRAWTLPETLGFMWLATAA